MTDSDGKPSSPKILTVFFVLSMFILVLVSYFGTVAVSSGGRSFSFLVVLPLMVVSVPVSFSAYLYRQVDSERVYEDTSYLGYQALAVLSAALVVFSILVLDTIFFEALESAASGYGSGVRDMHQRLIIGVGFSCAYWAGFLYNGRKRDSVIAGICGVCVGLIILLVSGLL